MKLIWLVVLMVAVACGQELPQAPKPKETHRFFSGANKWLIITSASLRATDVAQTCYREAHGAHESLLPGQGCLSVSGWSFGMELAGVGLSKLFHHFHHNKLELAPQILNTEMPIDGIVYSYTHQHQQPNISTPCVSLEACITVTK